MRYVLRKGFSLITTPEGVGHLSDLRTGDALVIPEADVAPLTAAMMGGLDPTASVTAGLLERYRPFLVESQEADAPRGFYELDIEDAHTSTPVAPTVAPLALSAEDELRRVLETARRNTPAPDLDLKAGEQPDASGRFLSQEENLKRALEHSEAPAPETPASSARDEVAALLDAAAKELEPPRAPVQPAPSAPPPSAGRPVGLAIVGVALLIISVVISFVLRSGADQPLAEVLDAGAPVAAGGDAVAPAQLDSGATQVAAGELDGGASQPGPAPPDAGAAQIAAAPRDAGAAQVATATPDAGAAQVATAQLDAGAHQPVAARPDAGAAPVAIAALEAGATQLAGTRPRSESGWVEATVQARGRVKMAELKAGAEGTLSWSVSEAQRVKSKQQVGAVTKTDGSSAPLIAESVGLVMIKQPAGAVKRGAVLAEIIYFEAWAKGLVKGATPTTEWRCEVTSVSANEKADCKVSVVTPKGGGAQVTVAIEPRWFDGATDAVLRLAPP